MFDTWIIAFSIAFEHPVPGSPMLGPILPSDYLRFALVLASLVASFQRQMTLLDALIVSNSEVPPHITLGSLLR